MSRDNLIQIKIVLLLSTFINIAFKKMVTNIYFLTTIKRFVTK